MKRIPNIIGLLLLVFGILAVIASGPGLPLPSTGWAASKDESLPQKRPEKENHTPPASDPLQQPAAPVKESAPEKKAAPFKEFVPSEQIEPDHAVDFPADI